MLKTYPFSKQNIIFWKIPFFLQVLLSSETIFNGKVRSFSVFENNILKFIRLTPKIVFNWKNHWGIKLITRMRVGRSHLYWDKFKHCFQDTLNPICSCSFVESTSHYILHCSMCSDERQALLSTIKTLIVDC